MSKSQHGNREAKKPKKVKLPEVPVLAVAVALPPGRSLPAKKKS